MKIIAVGDIMPGGVLNGTDRPFLAPEVKDLLKDGDIRVGTLETAIGNSPAFYEEKMKRKADVIYAEDDDMKRLVEMNINVVSLANNHFFDLGPEGATHTIELLDRMGIMHCGAGRDLEEASKPAVVEHEGKSYAFLAFCDWREETTGWCPLATENTFGVNPMLECHVVNTIKSLKQKYDYVIVFPHWGKEYDYRPAKYVFELSQKMVLSGADAILGSHTHCVQPIRIYKGKPIIYSMGNFLFPDRLICPPRSTCYPKTSLDYAQYPVTYGYPFVSEIHMKKWKPIARTGIIVEITNSKGSWDCKKYYTELTEDNLVQISHCPDLIAKEINKLDSIIKSGMYPIWLYYSRIKNHIRCSLIKKK